MRFFLDPVSKFTASYQDLMADLTGSSRHSQAHSSYSFIVQLLRRLLNHEAQIELRSLGSHGIEASATGSEPLRNFGATGEDLDQWRKRILESPSRILLETSGSTGEPQAYWHSVPSLTRGVRMDTEQQRSIWGLAYPLDHLAGLQVLFQSLMNFNPLIQLYRVEPGLVHQALDDYQISHLSCTPTFLRMVLAGTGVHPSLRRLTNGGERYDAGLDSRIRIMFPNASRRNIYASTEVGPLLVSDSDRFCIPDRLIPAVRIIEGELWLHNRLRVDNDLVRSPNKLEDRNEDNAAIPSDFFPTGDQVEVVLEQPLTIRFLSRKTEGFNVAGFRVDPVRLESIAGQHPSVANARFYGVPNSLTEHMVACDLVLARNPGEPDKAGWDETEFRNWFSQRVQRHEIPRMIKVVAELATTDSGKVKRL